MESTTQERKDRISGKMLFFMTLGFRNINCGFKEIPKHGTGKDRHPAAGLSFHINLLTKACIYILPLPSSTFLQGS